MLLILVHAQLSSLTPNQQNKTMSQLTSNRVIRQRPTKNKESDKIVMSPVIGSCMVVTCFPYIRQRNIRTVKTPESDIDIEDKKLKTK